MMVDLIWIKMILLLILGLQFTAVTGQTPLYTTVRDGDEATLSCDNVMTDQDNCYSTWIFRHSRNTAAVVPIKFGQIGEKAKAKSDRLSVTADCSLVIKNVTVEDAGRYTCRQYDRSGQQQGQDALVYLSVVSMTEHKDAAEVKLSCSVSTYDECRHTVKWLYEGSDSDINITDVQTSQPTCSVTVLLSNSHFTYESHSAFLQCNVTDLNSGKMQLYNFSTQLSGEATTTKPETTATQEGVKATPPTMTKSTIQSSSKAATTKTPAATANTITSPGVKATPPMTKPTIQSSSKAATTKTPAATANTITSPGTFPVWWLVIAVASAALIAIVVLVVAIKRKNTTGNNTQTIQGLSLNPAVTQSGLETSQDTVDPEEGCFLPPQQLDQEDQQ